MSIKNDEFWMKKALSLAKTAGEVDEVPVGAIIVKDDEIISSGTNRREASNLSTAHAEIVAIEKANSILDSWRLSGATLYVTLEPCLMCAGALYQSRISRVVYGASDPKGGALGSLYNIHQDSRLNHQFEVSSGILENECAQILKKFFRKKRKKN